MRERERIREWKKEKEAKIGSKLAKIAVFMHFSCFSSFEGNEGTYLHFKKIGFHMLWEGKETLQGSTFAKIWFVRKISKEGNATISWYNIIRRLTYETPTGL